MSKQFNRTGRREFVGQMAAAAALATPFIHARAAEGRYAGKTLKLLTWDDYTGVAATQHIAKSFEAKFGARVVVDKADGTGAIAKKVEATKEQGYDVVTLAGSGAVRLQTAGLLRKPDPTRIPSLRDVERSYQFGASEHGIGYLLWCNSLIYNKNKFKAPPDSYAVLWDESAKLRLFLPPVSWFESIDMVIIANKFRDRGNKTDQGFEKLAELKPRVVMLGDNPGNVAQAFKQDKIDIGGLYAPAFFPKEIRDPAYNMGVSFNMYEGFYADLLLSVIPKNHAADVEMIYAYINHSLDPAVQAKMAEEIYNGPINKRTVISADAQRTGYIPTPAQIEARASLHDTKFLSTVMDQWMARYKTIFA